MNPKQKIWRVRVKLAIEGWVEVTAETPEQAEMDAIKLPNVIQVFGRSALRGERPVSGPASMAVQEELFSDRD